MTKYHIKLNYECSIEVETMGEDEGDALGRAREIAENSDMSEFVITSEKESQVLSVE